jgi:hypothetical protein
MFSPFFGGHLPAMSADIPFVLVFYSSSLLAFWYSYLFSGIYFACFVGSHPGGYFAILSSRHSDIFSGICSGPHVFGPARTHPDLELAISCPYVPSLIWSPR